MGKSSPLIDRFNAKHTRGGPNECWPWNAQTDGDGYGRIWDGKGKTRGAHCVSWELEHGESIPPGMCACHSCDNPGCVNPKHIWLGTNTHNTADKVAKGRQAIGERISGPRRSVAGSANPRAVLNEQKVGLMRRLLRAGFSCLAMSLVHGVCEGTVKQIKSRRIWRHVP